MATKAQRAEAYRRNDLIKAGPTPLEVLLHNMRQALEQGDNETAGRWAIAAAPYCHPRMAAVKVQERRPYPVVLPTPMTPDEWIAAVGADVIEVAADYSGYIPEPRAPEIRLSQIPQERQHVTTFQKNGPELSAHFPTALKPKPEIIDTGTGRLVTGPLIGTGMARAERIATRLANDTWACGFCGGVLPTRKRTHAEFCSRSCRERSRHDRRMARRKAQSEGR